MKKIVFYAHKWHYISYFEPVFAECEKRKINFDILIVYPRDDTYLKYARKYSRNLVEPLYQNRLARTFFNPYSLPVPSALKPFVTYAAQALYFKHIFLRLFQKNKYEILVVSDDRAILPCVALSAAKALGLKTILFPGETILYVEDFLADRYAAAASPPTLKKRILSYLSKRLYPQNTAIYLDKELHHTPPRKIVSLFPFQLFPRNPWIRGANRNTDISAVGSDMQKVLDCARGASPENIYASGFPPHDRLYDIVKNKKYKRKDLMNTFGLAHKKIFLILGTHHIAERSDFIDQTDSASYENETNQALRAVTDTLGDEYIYLFKIHPQKNLQEQKQALSDDLRDKIVLLKNEYDTYELIAQSDAMLNFMSSATIAAFATNMPIFCYYLLKKSSSTHNWKERFRSIVQLDSIEELKDALFKLKKNTPIYEDFQARRIFDRINYGKYDGRSAERFVALLD